MVLTVERHVEVPERVIHERVTEEEGHGPRHQRDQESDDAEQMRSLAEEICAELEVHAAIEEAVFYPAVRALDVDKLTELVAESIEEHHVVKTLVKEITSLAESSDEKLAAKTTVLIENVEHHATEEEDEMFRPVDHTHLRGPDRAQWGLEARRERGAL